MTLEPLAAGKKRKATMTTAPNTLLVIGGSSDMAKATAQVFARNGWHIVLAGRNQEDLKAEATNIALRVPGSTVEAREIDILDTAKFGLFLDSLGELPAAVLCAVGTLGEQKLAETDVRHAETIMRTNFEGPSLLLGLVAGRFEQRQSGTIIGISSVAGDRGRASNYVYGSAKAGFTAFLSGLRNRLAKKGVHVVTIKPGFARTRMTEGMVLPKPLTAEPEEIGNAIWKAVVKKRDVVYVRQIWWLVMRIIRAIPESIFKKLSL